MMKKQKLMQTTKLLDVFARNITEEAKHIAIAKKHNLPLYEVVSNNTTLELTRFLKEANDVFKKYNTIRMYKEENGYKTLFRVKRNGQVLMGNLDVLGHAGA